ncbi:MAG: SAM-dependent DNA methyltransferase [Rhodospirillaceae bacterium]|nr:SAM-dependent DNA methyltransferase [Rhodospirillaceae bacterium]
MTSTSTFGLGAMMLGGKAEPAGRTGSERQAHDFYPTPEEATLALLDAEWPHLLAVARHGGIWEPACGDGRLARVLERKGFKVIGTDLIYRGYGDRRRRDFLAEREPLARAIITNPPFQSDIVVDFIQQALTLCPGYVAMLLKATFFHAAERQDLFRRYPPAMIYPLAWRLDFLGLGAPALECAWYVWRRRGPRLADRLPTYRPLMRPGKRKTA